jgi:predicted O-methyltransferase YrrM
VHLPWREVAPGAGPAIPTSITEAETARLRKLAAGTDALEIGAAYGYSTVVLAQEAETLISVDPHLVHDSYGIQQAHLNLFGLTDKVQVYRDWSQETLPKLIAARLQFDLIFIDGDHTAAGVEFDLTHALDLIRPGGVIAVHDVLETCCCPDVGPTVRRILAGRQHEVQHTADGLLFELVDTMAVVTA